MPRVIRTFREEYPLIALTLMEYNSGDLIELLVNERVDDGLHSPQHRRFHKDLPIFPLL